MALPLSFIKNESIALLILSVIFILRYYEIIYGFELFGPFKDNTYMLSPVYCALSEMIKNGEIPVFNPYLGGGIPMYNSPMLSFTYPLYFFKTLSWTPGIEALRLSTLLTLFHFGIFYFNTYICSRIIGIKSKYSILGAVIILLSGQLISNSPWMITICCYAWLPLVVAGIFKIFVETKFSYTSIFILVVGGSMLISKPAQPAIHAIFTSLILFILLSITNPKKIKLSILKGAIAAITIGLVISPAFIPAFIDFKEMVRWSQSGPIFGFDKFSADVFSAKVPLRNWYNFFIYTNPGRFGPGHPFISPIAFISVLLTPFVLLREQFRIVRMVIISLLVIFAYSVIS